MACRCRVYRRRVRTRRACRRISTRTFAASGLWPIIVGNSSDLVGFDELGRFVEDGSSTWAPPVGEILAAAAGLDSEAVLRQMWQDGHPIDEDADDPWRSRRSMNRCRVGTYGRSRPVWRDPAGPPPSLCSRSAVVSEIPAVVGWGDWTRMPSAGAARRRAAVLARALRRRASPMSTRHARARREQSAERISRPRLRWLVSSMPTHRTSSMQGEHSTVGSLASALIGSDHWHFWWD